MDDARLVISELMNHYGFTTGRIADQLKVSVYSVDRWRRGNVTPLPDRMMALTRMYQRERQRREEGAV